MGLNTVRFKNEPDAMENFVPLEGVYTIQAGATTERIASVPPDAADYDGGGAATATLQANQTYIWQPGANDTALSVVTRQGLLTLTKAGTVRTFVPYSADPAVTTATANLTGTASAAVTGLILLNVYFQKLWLYPFKSFAAGVPTANGANISLGKSGNAGTVYLPDTLAPTDLPIKYELPPGQKMWLGQVLIQGAAGDGVYYQCT